MTAAARASLMFSDAMLAGWQCAASGALVDFLKPFSAKYLSRLTGRQVDTCAGWKKGKFPDMRGHIGLVAGFGQVYLDAVFGPALAAESPLTRRLERVEADLAALKKEVADAERLAARMGANPARAKNGDGAGADLDRGAGNEVGALARGLAALRRGTAAALALMCLWSAVSADPGDDEWIRTRPPVARVLRLASGGRREGA